MVDGPLAPHVTTPRPTERHHRYAAYAGARTGGLGRPKPRGQLGGWPPGAERDARARQAAVCSRAAATWRSCETPRSAATAAAASSCEHRLAPARPLGDPCGTPRSAATRRSQPGSMKRGGNCTAMSHFPPCGAVDGKRRICANKVDLGRQHAGVMHQPAGSSSRDRRCKQLRAYARSGTVRCFPRRAPQPPWLA